MHASLFISCLPHIAFLASGCFGGLVPDLDWAAAFGLASPLVVGYMLLARTCVVQLLSP